MKGKVLHYDIEKGQGIINGDDGNRYNFTKTDIKSEDTIAQGVEIDFMSDDGENANDIYPLTPTHTPAQANVNPQQHMQGLPVQNKKFSASFNGCASRSDWWIANAVLFAGSIVLILLANVGAYPVLLAYPFLIWLSFAISIRRFHDLNKSGWWMLILFVPVIGWLAYFIMLGFLGSVKEGNMFAYNPVYAQQ